MEGNSLERYIEIYNSYFTAEKLEGENKKMKERKYPDCPAFDFTCPYCLASGECIIDNPAEECDTWYYYYGEEEDYTTWREDE